jgi:hypothetical protein
VRQQQQWVSEQLRLLHTRMLCQHIHERVCNALPPPLQGYRQRLGQQRHELHAVR